MLQRYLIIYFICGLSMAVLGQNRIDRNFFDKYSKVRGIVVDSVSMEPIPGALVSVVAELDFSQKIVIGQLKPQQTIQE